MPNDMSNGRIVLDRLTLECVTLGVSIRDCSSRLESTAMARVYDRLRRATGHLSDCVIRTADTYGGTVADVYATVTPVATVFDGFSSGEFVRVAETLDRAATDVGLDGIGGFSAMASASLSPGNEALIESIADVAASTDKVCASVVCASTLRGINFRAVDSVATVLSAGIPGFGGGTQSRISVLANASGSSPLLPGGYHGVEESEVVLGVAVSLQDPVAAIAGLPLAEAARTLLDIKDGLARGARFFQQRCAESLRQRSGLDVVAGRVELTVAPPPKPLKSEAQPLQVLDLMRRHGFLPPETGPILPSPIHRTCLRLEPDVSARDMTHVLVRYLTEAVAGGWELDISVKTQSG